MSDELGCLKWEDLLEEWPNLGAPTSEYQLHTLCERTLERTEVREHKGSHRWVTQQVLRLAEAKFTAQGSFGEAKAAAACSAGILAARVFHARRTKDELLMSSSSVEELDDDHAGNFTS